MKQILMFSVFLICLSGVFTISANAQNMPQTTTTQTVEANPNDVNSVDAIITAVYDVISGDAGVKRNWDRFRSLFHPSARLIPTGKNPQTGVVVARSLTPEDYITRSQSVLEKDGFHEREIARQTQSYGNIVHVFSTYEAKRKLSDEKAFLRGINSFQLFNDGKRWWVMTIFWNPETPENPIPKKYLKTKKEK
jgi:hypothetical protein